MSSSSSITSDETHGVWRSGHWCGAPAKPPMEDEVALRAQADIALGYDIHIVHPLWFEEGTFTNWTDLYLRTLAAVITHFLMALIPWATGRWGGSLAKHPYVQHFCDDVSGKPFAVHFRWDSSRIVSPDTEDCVWLLTRSSLLHYVLYYATLALMAAPGLMFMFGWAASGWLERNKHHDWAVYLIAGSVAAYVLWVFILMLVGKLLIRGPGQPIRIFALHPWYLFVSAVQFGWSFVRLFLCCGGPCCCCGQPCPFPRRCPCQRRRLPRPRSSSSSSSTSK